MADNPISAREKLAFRKALEGISEKTVSAYQGLAENFYATRLGGEAPTPKRIADALRKAAGDYRPGYFRKLRNALMYDQIGKGYFEAAQRLKETKNPITTGKTKSTVKPKQRRCKSIDDDDLSKLYSAALEKPDTELASAVMLAAYTGCRPAEMTGIRRVAEDQVFVPGAKKSKGERGLDRIITLSKDKCDVIETAVGALYHMDEDHSKAVHQVQSRLDRLTLKLWPRRKARPTLYTLRHQMGSDLKASGLSRVEIAYVMGHQSTESVEVYGDRRKKSGRGGVKPAPVADLSVIRQKHDQTPGPKAPSVKTTYNGPSGMS
jgi:integrase